MGKEYEEIKVELEIIIESEDIDNIMVSALEGGITYWCNSAKVYGEYLGKYASEQISRGGELLLHCVEKVNNEEWVLLSKEKFMSGLKTYIADMPVKDALYAEANEYRIDTGFIDGV